MATLDELRMASLENLLNGAAVELFNNELRKVVADIQDQNTDPKAVRVVTLTFKVKPHEADRTVTITLLGVNSKLAGPKPVAGILYMDRQGGEAVALERIQFEALPDAATASAVASVTPLRPASGQ